MANIELDGGNKKITVDSGDLTLDIPGDIILDADGGDLTFADGGTNLLKVTNSSSDVVLQPQVDAKDIIFKQYDGRNLLEINDGGYVAIANGATGPGQLRLYEDTDNGTNYTAFQVGTQSGDVTYTLPTADGSNGQVLSTNGSGTLSWGAAGGFTVSDITGATALAAQPAATDEMVLSDAGSLKRLDIKHIQNTPAFAVYKSADQAISDTAYTKVAFNTEVYDTDGTYDNSTNYRFTPAVAGKYFLTTSIFARHTDGDDELHNLIVSFYKNGSIHSASASFSDGNNDGFSVCHTDTIDLDGDDYVEVYAFAQVATDTPVLEATTTSDGSRALGRGLTFGGFRVTGV